LRLAERLRETRHIEVVGAPAVGEAVHGAEQIFLAQAGEPRRRRVTLEILAVAGAANGGFLGDFLADFLGAAWRRRSAGARGHPPASAVIPTLYSRHDCEIIDCNLSYEACDRGFKRAAFGHDRMAGDLQTRRRG